MQRYVQITGVFVLPVMPGQEEALDATIHRGLQILGDHMVSVAPQIDELVWDWKMMPAEYAPKGSSRKEPSADLHPWNQGLWIFPEDHPLREYEERAKAGDESAHVVIDQAIGSVKELGDGNA